MQDLLVWASRLNNIPQTNTNQRIPLSDEEFLDGWLLNSVPDAQQFNQLFYLLTSYSSPNPYAPQPHLSTRRIPDGCIKYLASEVISETDSPELFKYYGATFPPEPYQLTSPWIFIVRNQ